MDWYGWFVEMFDKLNLATSMEEQHTISVSIGMGMVLWYHSAFKLSFDVSLKDLATDIQNKWNEFMNTMSSSPSNVEAPVAEQI